MHTCRNLLKLLDDTIYLSNQLEILLFDEERGDIPVKLYTDSKPTLESIASSKQVERKLLRNSITDLKKRLEDGSIQSYSWLDTKDMVADLLTKESKDDDAILDIVQENKFKQAQNEDNLVHFDDGEIKMTNMIKKRK